MELSNLACSQTDEQAVNNPVSHSVGIMYAVQHRNTPAAKEYGLSESSIRRFKQRYLEASQAIGNSTVTLLPTMKCG